MVGSKFGDEVGRVFGGVDGERLGDNEESGGEFGDGELFSGALEGEEGKKERMLVGKGRERGREKKREGGRERTRVVAKFSR